VTSARNSGSWTMEPSVLKESAESATFILSLRKSDTVNMIVRSLFVKIFLWFWLTIILFGAILEVSTYMIRYEERQWKLQIAELFPDETKKAADIFERSGEAALATHLQDLQRR